jgi:carbonic anhydrase/acetyltransferase-like protein (isoleucine patch superfamily)
MWVMWNLPSVHLKTELLVVQDRCTVCATCTIGSKIILGTPMVLLGDDAKVEACWVHLVIVLVSVQDRCTVCTKCTIGSDIVLEAPDGTPN